MWRRPPGLVQAGTQSDRVRVDSLRAEDGDRLCDGRERRRHGRAPERYIGRRRHLAGGGHRHRHGHHGRARPLGVAKADDHAEVADPPAPVDGERIGVGARGDRTRRVGSYVEGQIAHRPAEQPQRVEQGGLVVVELHTRHDGERVRRIREQRVRDVIARTVGQAEVIG